jgi:hypothetical protein
MAPLGKALIVTGLLLVVLGAAIWSFGSAAIPGRLPGDLYLRRGNFSFYFPITTHGNHNQHRAEPDRGLAEALSRGPRS